MDKTTVIFLVMSTLLIGVLAYYWFDIGYRIKPAELVTITQSEAEVEPLELVMVPTQKLAEEAENAKILAEKLNQTTEPSTESKMAYAYLAGGCFWCVEKDFEKLSGVTEVVSGYSGGDSGNPTYSNHSDHREAVQVAYDPSQISYEEILHYFFRHHDGTDAGGSFYDRGHSYTSAIYYQTLAEEVIARQVKAQLDASGIFTQPLVTAIEPFKTFTIAEEYHQNYYKKNPVSAAKYRAYRQASGRDRFIESVQRREQELKSEPKSQTTTEPWSNYEKPADELLKTTLSPLQYRVTQKHGTEKPFSEGNLNDEARAGIFVDILSGEPLFSSAEKFDSGTGWPSFTQPIDEAFITTKKDYLLLYPRTEVRSKFGDNHLGHVFNDGPRVHNGEDSTGQRWCINGAALRFVPLEEMVAQGYGEYVEQVQ